MDNINSIIISIRPIWCEKIVIGKKLIELRKSIPNLKPPFTVYVYCTSQFNKRVKGHFQGISCGKVVGEFLCEETIPFFHHKTKTDDFYVVDKEELSELCLTYDQLWNYGKNSKILYGLCISNFKLYEKPKDLSDFENINTGKVLTRPPQSWCYAKERQVI